ncbi:MULTISPECIES: mechanosensitive ion channel domain-containing protein [unclassified Sphingopyxis]|uniref:mechanosensitive ion channel family protein n=1 Tax=Sphingopyxis sp. H073 TaxID=1759079 RepID=UPI000730F7CF|nr:MULTISPECIES: mechanosensitive ion channel domain-containing protein [unclassified Sphingopyxis]KTE28260.1 mechanosensitive ion channel protein MscS [Sphingopyxis sp. H057]KTE55358.1 mechanosensitive ion channel protein MscS [Sphingopyxis sp. H073]KTE57751.1 mechanosensitive ion channel protein MscS [Sphingopyxis sp. H071]KTE59774.1 mechanosensitive ion channel protein MscS [Sphingopyxis sp. H100]KTE61012.1 mechanosensitive ion channel protein MscS [Sphingopyxis sp. H107]
MTFAILPAAHSATTTTAVATKAPAAATNPLEDLRHYWDISAAWVNSHWLQIGIAVGAGLLIYFLLSMVRTFALKHAQSAEGDLTLTHIAGRVIHKTRSTVIAIVAIRMVAGYAQPPAAIMQIVQFVFTIAVVLQVAIWVREIILGLIQRRAAEGNNETLSNAMGIIRLLISVALFAIAAIVILDNMGVNVTGLIAGLGIGGIAIGLAAQGIFSDLFASLSIIFDRPFRVGETIKYDTSTATVERIGLKSTRLRSLNGELLVISNTNLLSKEITNFAHLHRRRITFRIGVIYQTTPEMLRDLPALLEAQVVAAGHEFIRSSFLTFGSSSLDFELLFDVFSDDFDVVAAARTDVGIRLFEAMAKAGYEFAYPTQTTFTAAPDGTMIMPFAESPKPKARSAKTTKPG